MFIVASNFARLFIQTDSFLASFITPCCRNGKPHGLGVLRAGDQAEEGYDTCMLTSYGQESRLHVGSSLWDAGVFVKESDTSAATAAVDAVVGLQTIVGKDNP